MSDAQDTSQTPAPDRVDGYLSRKAQQLDGSALVYERADGSWILERQNETDVLLGDSFGRAGQALRAIIAAARAGRDERPLP